MNAKEILKIISSHSYVGYHDINIPEFTFKDFRIDLVKIDLRHRWIRGFEIKADRGDFLKDEKWTLYSRFVSTLTIVCPEGLIKKEEIEKPFGLMWIIQKNRTKYSGEIERFYVPKWIKRPKCFQKRASLAWLWTYVEVLELEFPRVVFELDRLKLKLEEK